MKEPKDPWRKWFVVAFVFGLWLVLREPPAKHLTEADRVELQDFLDRL